MEDGHIARVHDLARRAGKGDRDALSELCSQIAAGVLFRAMRITLDEHDAKDVAQEVLIKVCTGIRGLKEPKAFYGWLAAITINESRRLMIKKGKQAGSIDVSEYADTLADDDDAFMPGKYLIRKEDREAVIEAIDKLPSRQREAVILKYYDDLSVNDIAEAMGISQPNVSSYLKLAKDKIRSELESRMRGAKDAPKDGPSYALSSVPIGALLTGVMEQEAASFAVHHKIWLKGAVEGGLDAAANAASASKLPLIFTPGVTAIISAAAVAGVLLLSGLFGGLGSHDTHADGAVGEVVFSGSGPGSAHVNPASASPVTDSGMGALFVQGWQILTIDTETVLFSGTGDGSSGDIPSALTEMRDDYTDGEYLIRFSLKDAVGGMYILESNFVIRR